MLEVRSVLRKFKVSFEKEVHQSNMEVMKQILSLFENYMEKNFNERNFEGSINEIPMYFNDFILKSLGNTIENTKYLYVCELLSKLAFWLKQSSLTEL